MCLHVLQIVLCWATSVHFHKDSLARRCRRLHSRLRSLGSTLLIQVNQISTSLVRVCGSASRAQSVTIGCIASHINARPLVARGTGSHLRMQHLRGEPTVCYHTPLLLCLVGSICNAIQCLYGIVGGMATRVLATVLCDAWLKQELEFPR